MSSSIRLFLLRLLPLAAIALLAGCSIAKPRTDDPHEQFNRKVYAFNDSLDQAVIRPVAVGYRKVTNPPVRRAVSDFFTNIKMPITVANDLLQARPLQAARSTGRFLVNLTLGVGGFFDPASQLGLPLEDNDFGITLARWGVPEGDFLMLPFVGPTTVRDVWRLPVDSYFFDPLSYFSRNHEFHYGQYYIPQVLYLVTIRSRAIDAESFLKSAYDPYVFLRDAYRQQRIYQIYDGNPPAEVIEQMQGLKETNFDPDELLNEQHQWEQKQSQEQPAAQKPSQN
ncbi:VacJ family lipoprotein [Dyella sp. LX-66]|uniref:MlaA family lipoprotein n=1 Tax=unclassified Dyella TaxID=2634549 RepID=UPI001BE013C3|nr:MULTISPECIES: VacJ family lipoprotein [unclassified Dyella]MBT2115738.1 VacJ family lipoprotein [Dyella sp. LX-1]MBT2139553.1 VacJ family lipoprotein [Dyella sp. LX-66]